MLRKQTIKIGGMSCAACATRIEKGLNRLPGVKTANVNLAIEKATVEFDDKIADAAALDGVVEKLGYTVIKEEEKAQNKVALTITGMSCAACSARIEKKLGRTPGVKTANVNLTT
jgi:P-type Cu+ transporter